MTSCYGIFIENLWRLSIASRKGSESLSPGNHPRANWVNRPDWHRLVSREKGLCEKNTFSVSEPKQKGNLASIVNKGVSDLGWSSKGQNAIPADSCGKLVIFCPICMHNVFIQVNDSKLSYWKHDFVEKSVGDCRYIPIMTSFLRDLTWPGHLTKSCPKDVS